MSFSVVSSMSPATFTNISHEMGFKKYYQRDSLSKSLRYSHIYWRNPSYNSGAQSNEARCYITNPIFKSLLECGELSTSPPNKLRVWTMVRADDAPMNHRVREQLLYKRFIIYEVKYNLYIKE